MRLLNFGRSRRSGQYNHLQFRSTAQKSRFWRRPIFLLALLLLVAVGPGLYLLLRHPNKAEAAWYDASWSFRQKFPITNSSGSTQTSFQVKLTVDTATLVSNGKMQSNCADVRVTDSSANVLPYWIEPTTCNTTSTFIWVNVSTIATGTTTNVYMYYGNNGAADTSSTSTTFIRDMTGAAANWPLDETNAAQTYSRVINPALATGRNMVIDPGFADPTKWTTGSGWSVTGGVLHSDGTGGTAVTAQSIPLVTAKSYSVTYTISNYSGSSSVTARFSGGSGTARSANGTYTETLTTGNTAINFVPTAGFVGDIDNISVTQLNISVSTTLTGTELVSTGDFSSTGTWTATGGWAIGSGIATHTPGSGGNLTQTLALVSGLTYKLTFTLVVNAGSGVTPTIGGTAGTTAATTNTYTLLIVSGSTPLTVNFPAASTLDGTIDNVSVIQVDPMVGLPTNGVTLGSASGGHLTNAYTFDGTNDNVNIYSSDLNSVFSGGEGTISVWAKVSGAGVWTDGINRRMIGLFADANNQVRIIKNTTNNQIAWTYTAGGTSQQVILGTASSIDWMFLTFTWSKSANEVKAYLNGAQVSTTQTGLATWVGNLSSTLTVIGSVDTSGNNPWSGMINDARIYSRALSAAEVSDLYSSTTDIQAYATNNYSGHELVRKYNDSVTVGSSSYEEVGSAPAAYWKFDEGTSQTINNSGADASTDNGTLGASSASASDDPTWQTEDQCISGKCLSFDGTNDYVNTVDDPLDLGTSSFSVSAWAKMNSTATGQIDLVDKRSGALGTNPGFTVKFFTSQQLRIGIGDSTTSVTIDDPAGGSRADSKWHYYTAVFDRTNNLLVGYIDGKQVISGSTASVTGSISNAKALTIGTSSNSPGTENFNGFVDEVKIYKYARTAAQVKTDFLQGAGQTGSSSVQGSKLNSILSNGQVGYWKLDEASGAGTTLADSSGNTNTGTATLWGGGNTSTDSAHVAGKYSYGFSLDGGDDYVAVADASSLDFSDQLTFSTWVKPTNFTNGKVLLGKWNQTSNQRSYVATLTSGGKVKFFTSSTGSNTTTPTGSATALTTGVWNHVVVTKSGTTVKYYINGALDATETQNSSAIFNSTAEFRIGRDYTGAAGDPFIGTVDETRVYSRSFSPAEVQQLYTWAPGPVGYWKMDEKSGTTADDSSGSSFTGTYTGSPAFQTGKYGGAPYFTTTTKYVTIPDNDALDLTTAISIGFWMKPDDAANLYRVIRKGNPYNASGTGLSILYRGDQAGDPISIQLDDGSVAGGSLSGGNIGDITNTWTHIEVVCDKSTTTCTTYKNSILNATASFSSFPGSFNTSSAFIIGGDVSGYNGQLDDVRVYNYARTPAQVQEDMRGASGVISTVAGSASATQPGSPLAYWKFDEGYGTTANSSGSVGSGNNGTLTNMASPATSTSGWTTAGKVNSALSFDGTDDAVSFTSANAITATQGSVSVWFKPNGSQASPSYIFAGRQSAGTARVYITMSALNAVCTLSSGTTIGTVAITSGTWNHVACTWDGTTAAMYVNGVDKTIGHTITTLTAPATTSYIGAFDTAGSSPFNGQIDEVKTFGFALTPEQVKIEYNMGAAVNYNVGATTEAANDPTNGAGNAPVLDWEFEERTGSTTNDSSGKAHTGTAQVAATWATGKYGSGIQTNIRGFYTPDAADLDNTSAITVEAWVYITQAVNFQRFVGKYFFTTVSNGSWLLYQITNNAVQFAFNNGSSFQSLSSGNNVLSLNQWTHVAATYNGTVAKIYVNGVVVASGNLTGPIVDSAYCTTVGYTADTDCVSSSQNHLQGKMDGVKIYNYGRTADQIAYDYNRGAPVAWWKMDECQGTTLNDSSGFTNTATIVPGTGVPVGSCNTASTSWGNGAVGKYNASLSFDGTDDYASFSRSSSIQGMATQGSISFWTKDAVVDSNLRTAVDIAGTGTTGLIMLTTINTTPSHFRLQYGSGAATTLTSSTVPVVGTWYHVVGTWNTSGANLYVNGKLEATTTTVPTITISSGTAYIGSNGGTTRYANGQLDDVRLFNYPLSVNQIKKLYNDGASVFYGPSTGSP